MSLFIQGNAVLQQMEIAMRRIGDRGDLLRRDYQLLTPEQLPETSPRRNFLDDLPRPPACESGQSLPPTWQDWTSAAMLAFMIRDYFVLHLVDALAIKEEHGLSIASTAAPS